MPRAAVVDGLGSCLPDRPVTNADLESFLPTSDQWIRQRTGIASRYWVAPGTGTGDLAVAAGRAALESSGQLGADLVILATTTPDHPCPATSPDVASRLGLGNIPAFDLSAVCSGFVYGLSMARAAIRSGQHSRVLLIAADTYSTIINKGDRATAVIFGDGAGAVTVRSGDPGEPGELLDAHLGSEGEHAGLIGITAGGSRMPDPVNAVDPGDRYFRMQGSQVYRHAVQRMTESSRTVMRRMRWSPGDIRAFIAHQANQRILDAVGDRLGIPPGRRLGNIHKVGNTAAASIPLAFAAAASENIVPAGSMTLFTAFGGGLTWGTVALTWPQIAQAKTLHLAETGALPAPTAK
ncbi:ketoacyl-ACP synthase III [Streptomyces sp. 5-10]|nr:ketoacyl-ACP synthase III [Streptomyces sp. 5-10]